MENAIVLTNGDKVILRQFCTRKIYKEIQRRSWSQNPEVVGGKFENAKINILTMADAEDYAVFAMIEKVSDAQGQDKQITEQYVENLSVCDYNLISKKVNEITKPIDEEDKKK